MAAETASVTEERAVATCDFAENFLYRFQEEPQSARWAYRQVTLFPVFFSSPCVAVVS